MGRPPLTLFLREPTLNLLSAAKASPRLPSAPRVTRQVCDFVAVGKSRLVDFWITKAAARRKIYEKTQTKKQRIAKSWTSLLGAATYP
eukprot:747466-Pyramimonas_sp.AAC.1